jgi:RND family efflux transporter MFP subunit
MIRTILKALLPLIVLVGAAYGVKLLLDSRPEPEKLSDPPPPLLVRAVTAGAEHVLFEVRSQGDVMARTESRLHPRVAGLIEWCSPAFKVGGFFAKGDVLLRLHQRDFELAIVQAEARVAAADLAVAREESEAQVALSEWETLGTGEAGPLVLRVPQLVDARASAAAARAALEQARLNLERTEITAPFDGRVRTHTADIGQVVQEITALAMLYAIDQVEVRLPVPDEQLQFLDMPMDFRGHSSDEVGPPVTLSARFAGREWSWEGRIVRVEGEIDPLTRMVHMIAMVEDPYGMAVDAEVDTGRPPLALGMFVSAVIRGLEVPDVVVLPRAAIRSGSRVFVVDDEGRLRFRNVEVLRAQGERVVLASGVEPGERVCVSILETPVDGMAVRVDEASGDVAADIRP